MKKAFSNTQSKEKHGLLSETTLENQRGFWHPYSVRSMRGSVFKILGFSWIFH